MDASPRLSPTAYETTRASVHALCEMVLAPARHAVQGRVGLEVASNGVVTPPLDAAGTRLGLLDGRLASGDRRGEVTHLRGAAAFFGVEPGVPAKLWSPTTSVAPDARLAIDEDALGRLLRWFGLADQALRIVAAGGGATPITLWPEHFDLATTIGRVNIGASPGDGFVGDPYLYVGPWDRPYPSGPAWSQPFGAVATVDEAGSVDAAVDFFLARLAELRRR